MIRALDDRESTRFLERNKERISVSINELRTELRKNIKFLQENSHRLDISTLPIIQLQISSWKKILSALEGF